MIYVTSFPQNLHRANHTHTMQILKWRLRSVYNLPKVTREDLTSELCSNPWCSFTSQPLGEPLTMRLSALDPQIRASTEQSWSQLCCSEETWKPLWKHCPPYWPSWIVLTNTWSFSCHLRNEKMMGSSSGEDREKDIHIYYWWKITINSIWNVLLWENNLANM